MNRREKLLAVIVGGLLLLLFYIYGVMGVAIFRDNDPVHFGNLKLSLLTLFRVVTLEDWTDPQRLIIDKQRARIYDDFLERVSASRGMTKDEVHAIAEGRVFTDFYVTQAVCSASRAGLLTGCRRLSSLTSAPLIRCPTMSTDSTLLAVDAFILSPGLLGSLVQRIQYAPNAVE